MIDVITKGQCEKNKGKGGSARTLRRLLFCEAQIPQLCMGALGRTYTNLKGKT